MLSEWVKKILILNAGGFPKTPGVFRPEVFLFKTLRGLLKTPGGL